MRGASIGAARATGIFVGTSVQREKKKYIVIAEFCSCRLSVCSKTAYIAYVAMSRARERVERE